MTFAITTNRSNPDAGRASHIYRHKVNAEADAATRNALAKKRGLKTRYFVYENPTPDITIPE